MRYMAKVLRDALREKFPQAPEKDILKVPARYHQIDQYILLFSTQY